MLCSTKRLLMNQLTASPLASQASFSFGLGSRLLSDSTLVPERKFAANLLLTKKRLESRATEEAGLGRSLQRVLQAGWKDIRRRSIRPRTQLQIGVPSFSA